MCTAITLRNPISLSRSPAFCITIINFIYTDDYEDFESLENMEKSSYVLGSELWESKFDGLLALVKEYIVDVWEIRKHKLYDSDSGSGLQLHTQSSPGERSGKFSQSGKFGQNGKFSQNGKFGQNDMSGQKGKSAFRSKCKQLRP